MMDRIKKFFALLADKGIVSIPRNMSEEESEVFYRALTQFAESTNVSAELLRTELSSDDSERIEKQLTAIRDKLRSVHAIKMESDCNLLIKHLRFRGPKNSLVHSENFISSLLELSINIQVARHQAMQEQSDLPIEKNDQLLTVLLSRLQEALEEFNDEKSLRIIEKIKSFEPGEKVEKLREYASTFEFDKALRVLNELRSNSEAEKIVKKKTVLAVDDMPSLLTQLKAIIGDRYRFVGVTSADAALRYLERGIPDVYILDIDMPEMNGFQLLEAIKARRKIAPVIFLTANATVEYVEKAFDLGVTNFLVKPCNEEAVHAKLEAVFAS